MAKSLEQLVGGTTRLATLPEVYLELERLIGDPEASLEDMAAVIRRDGAFSSQLLRIANSSFYGFPRQIDNVRTALSVVGTRQLRDLLLATAVIRSFRGLPVAADMDAFWRHSLACAAAARVIATMRREPNVEQLYLCGLFHEIGRLIFFLGDPEGMARALRLRDERSCLLSEAEREVFGFDHAELGAAFLAAWSLPEVFEQAVRHYQHPSTAADYQLQAAIVHVANIMTIALGLEPGAERYVPPLDEAAYATLAINPASTAQLVQLTERQFEEAVRLFLG